ncbi:MAG TPA: hypothetical protein DEP36_13345, partial [Gammaproteobacteria bacterium]|nr:hypothetical protein [Gammaproteobacteria bacterium]
FSPRRLRPQPQALDHILISPALRNSAVARISHNYSDMTPSQPEPASDHAPVVAELPALEDPAATLILTMPR